MNGHYCTYCMQKRRDDSSACEHCHNTAVYDAPIHHIKPGTVLKEKYMIGRALGEGGFGITYIGRDLTLDMRIAVKEFYPSGYAHRNHNYANEVTLTQSNSGLDFEKDMQRFLNEARTLAKFSEEPGVVGVRDFFRENGTAYIVMEYLDGITLKNYLKTHGTIPADKLFEMLDPVMASLNLIHAQGLIHRDISPDNIMVLKNGKLKLLDFGAAREVNSDKSLSVVLKHGYAPEEQYRSKGQQGPWTDVYAMCATIYKCLTGITPPESLERAYDDELQAPSKLGIPISRTQEAALLKGLCVRVGDRIQSVNELREGIFSNDDEKPIQSVTVHKPVEDDDVETVYEPINKDPVSSLCEDTAEALRDGSAPGEENNGRKRQLNHNSPKTNYPKKKFVIPAIITIVAIMVIVLIIFGSNSNSSKANDHSSNSLDNVTITSTPGTYSYSLTQVGSIADSDRSLQIIDDVLLQNNGDTSRLLTYLGEIKNDIDISNVEYLGQGLYTVQDCSGGANSTGLITQDGKVLIPCEACKIFWPNDMLEDEGRYLIVAFTTGETTSTDECFISVTDYGWSFNSPQIGDTWYSGYALVYDLESSTYVENAKTILRDISAIQTCGDTFIVKGADGVAKLYSENGEVLFQTKNNISVGVGTFIVSDNGTYRVYDEYGNQTYSSNKSLRLISGNGGYISKYENDGIVILDRNGNQIVETTYESVWSEVDNVFRVKNAGKYGLIRADGAVVMPCDIFDGGINYIDYGLYSAYTSDGIYALIGSTGVIAVDLPYSINNNLRVQDGEKLFIINDGEYSLSVEDTSVSILTMGMVAAQSASDKLYGIFDLFTGEQLLQYEYEVIKAAAGYIYAYRNGSWEVYLISGPEENKQTNTDEAECALIIDSEQIEVGQTTNAAFISGEYTYRSDDNLLWTSSNPEVASISQDGTITGLASGSTVIMGQLGDLRSELTIIVVGTTETVSQEIVKFETLEINCHTSKLLVGDTVAATLIADAWYLDGNSDGIVWSIDDESVATINGAGHITGLAPGICTVTAKYKDLTASTELAIVEVDASSSAEVVTAYEKISIYTGGSSSVNVTFGGGLPQPYGAVVYCSPNINLSLEWGTLEENAASLNIRELYGESGTGYITILVYGESDPTHIVAATKIEIQVN